MTRRQAKIVGKTLTTLYGGVYGKYRDSKNYSVWFMLDGVVYWVDNMQQYLELLTLDSEMP